jgi:hypothetical protein
MTVYAENKNINKKIDWIGYYQIGGGILGVVFLLDIITSNLDRVNIQFLYYLLPLTFFSFSAYSGYALIKRKTNGVLLTKINQYLQLPQIGILGFSFQYVAGLFLGLGISGLVDIGFNFNLADFTFSLSSSPNEIIFMINLVPIILLNRLEKYNTKLKKNKKIIETLENEKDENN